MYSSHCFPALCLCVKNMIYDNHVCTSACAEHMTIHIHVYCISEHAEHIMNFLYIWVDHIDVRLD